MNNRMEEEFEDIFHKALPLILFSYPRYREPLIEKVSGLFRALNAIDTMTFDEIARLVTKMIDEREVFDSERERLITVFYNRDKSYDEKFRELYEDVTALKIAIADLKKEVNGSIKKVSTS